MRVSYDKGVRENAKKKGACLYTFQITGPGGGGSVTSQGFYSVDTVKNIKGLIDIMVSKPTDNDSSIKDE